MGIDVKYGIKEKALQQAFQALERKADEGRAGNFEILEKGVTKDDASKLTEGKRYIDTKNNRAVFRVGSKILYSELAEMGQGTQAQNDSSFLQAVPYGIYGSDENDSPILTSGNYYYLKGNADTDGSWRFNVPQGGNASIEYRKDGAWVVVLSLEKP